MGIEKEKSFVVLNGVDVSYQDSGVDVIGPFFTGGPTSPVGLDLPIETMYVQNDAAGVVLWEKFGSGVTDWKIYPATKIGFDNATAQLTGNPSNIQAAIEQSVLQRTNFNFHTIPVDTEVKIQADQQLYVRNGLKIKGQLTIQGSLVVE